MSDDNRKGADLTAVRVDGIKKTFNFGRASEKVALTGVSFHLQPGDFAVVIGSNGAGKSTLLNALAGEVVVDHGSININGQSVEYWPVHRRARFISRVFQDPMLGTAPSLSIEENLALALLRGKPKGLRRGLNQRYRVLFRERLALLGLGLENRLNEKVEMLSGGQRQSLTLIMATLVVPKLLLLDEHTAALDPRAGELVMKATIEAIKENAITTLMVTHNMEQAIQYGNHLLMMHDGKVILDIKGGEKANLTVSDLIKKFHITSDKMLLH